MTEEEIQQRICAMAQALGFIVNKNIGTISKIKSRMDNPRRCPCDPTNPLRYCGSILCEEETVKDGHCHCNLMLSNKHLTETAK